MKLKMFLVITDPPAFAAGRFDYSISLMVSDPKVSGWISCGEIEVDFGHVDLTEARAEALQMIDEKIKQAREEFANQLSIMEDERAKLLALPAPEAAS